MAGRDLIKDYANPNCEYRVVSNPIQVEEKSVKLIAINFYPFCVYRIKICMEHFFCMCSLINILVGCHFIFGPEMGMQYEGTQDPVKVI